MISPMASQAEGSGFELAIFEEFVFAILFKSALC